MRQSLGYDGASMKHYFTWRHALTASLPPQHMYGILLYDCFGAFGPAKFTTKASIRSRHTALGSTYDSYGCAFPLLATAYFVSILTHLFYEHHLAAFYPRHTLAGNASCGDWRFDFFGGGLVKEVLRGYDLLFLLREKG